MTQPHTPRRGRPTVFDEPTRQAFLDAVRHGMRLGEAAEHAGINRAVPTRHARTDRKFAAALVEAREVGAKVRQEGIPHDEYRYNMLKCRCPKCTRAATTARAGRRAAEDPPGNQGPADVHPIRVEGPGVGESLPAFLLARAS
ncbi:MULTISPECIES: hypothetical protein [unclassified Streptomyces]|uniref:hypothetical protein n=1 Tax=unclassified Streptomyces TaxID=2593676 RepID=UPI000804D7C9|nr:MULTISPECIES: hypothetical protein [unclassified Streptomyces]MYR75138.1 hypothetical protein [Streptomyces sp. SID4925]SBU98025.1 hypothetical protein YUMDRAFT_06008 [Streptomyces sp. OspMP-M45]